MFSIISVKLDLLKSFLSKVNEVVDNSAASCIAIVEGVQRGVGVGVQAVERAGALVEGQDMVAVRDTADVAVAPSLLVDIAHMRAVRAVELRMEAVAAVAGNGAGGSHRKAGLGLEEDLREVLEEVEGQEGDRVPS